MKNNSQTKGKIAFLLDTFPSPTETFIARDIDALRRHGLEIEVFALQAGEGARPLATTRSLSLLARGVWEKLSQPGLRPGYFQGLGAAWWQALEQSGEARHFRHIHAGWASHPAYMAWGAAQKSRLPWSFSGHARDIFVMGGDLKGKLQEARFAAVCTRAAARHLKNLAPQHHEKIIYAPHGVNAREIEFSEWHLPAAARLLAVGRLVEKKGFSVLLDACAILQARHFSFHLTIVGDGPLRETLTLRRNRLNLQEVVAFSGALPPTDILPLMRQLSCLVVASQVAPDGDRDGLPNVILEAAACGLPVVATRAGAIDEFVDENTGVLCAAGQAEELADAIQGVFASSERTEERRIAARRLVETQFDSLANAAHLAAALSGCA